MKYDYYTYNEIISQQESWERVYQDIINEEIKFNIDFFSRNYDEVIFFGCGSSYNVSQSASFFSRSVWDSCSFIALPSSELLINTDIYIKPKKKYLVIGFSRSGETPETIEAVKKLKEKSRGEITALTFTCRKDSSISNYSDQHFVCDRAVEKSVVMTVSFSVMLFAYCLMLAKFLNMRLIIDEFNYLINYTKNNMSDLFKKIETYIDKNDFSSYFVLGSGFNYGLAVEADLKMKEMSQTPSYSYHIYEFNHGPKSLVDKDALCLFLNLSKVLFKTENIIKEILGLGARILIIGNRDFVNLNQKRIDYLSYDAEFKSNLVASFLNIPLFQILAYIKTVKKNLNPDKPRNLSYTTEI